MPTVRPYQSPLREAQSALTRERIFTAAKDYLETHDIESLTLRRVAELSGVSPPTVYALTKGAVAGFTKGLARDLGPRGITVNNVQPGPIDTDMNPADGEFAKFTSQYIALQRYGHSDEIASFVAYLASPEASFITGASLLADGGYTA